MTTQRKVLKMFIIIILAVFLLATGLTSVMYLASPKNSVDQASGTDLLSWTTTVVETPAIDTGKTLPTMTKEEAQKQLEQLLSWNKK